MNSSALKKPLLRGHFHQAAFFIAIGACGMLISQAQNSLQFVSSIIYTIGLTGLLGISALYHRPQWSTSKRKFMRRLDHCMIFVLIAGTFTPVCLLALSRESGIQLLWLCWIIAAMGCVQSLIWISAPKWLASLLYVIAVLAVAPHLPELYRTLSSFNMVLLVSGGAIYVIGAAVYALKRPNPYPKVFGYHEIFHLLVIAAAALHFILVNSFIG